MHHQMYFTSAESEIQDIYAILLIAMKVTSQSCWTAIKSLLSITVTKVFNFFKLF